VTPPLDALVIGAGLSGALSARILHEAGWRVLVLEAAPAPGGKLGRAHADGAEGTMPVGPSTFLGRHPVFFRALARAGRLEDAVQVGQRWPERYLVREGRLRALRQAPPSLLTSRAIPTRTRLGFVKDALLGGSAPRPGDSLDSAMRRAFGDSFADGPLAGMVQGIWAGDASALDAEACMPELLASAREAGGIARGLLRSARAKTPAAASESRSGTWTLRGGLPGLVEGLLEGVPLRTGAPVASVSPEGHVTLASGEELRAHRVLLATEAPAAAALLEGSSPVLSQALTAIPTAPVAVVRWEAAPGGPRGFGWLAAPREGRSALGDLFLSDILEDDRRLHAAFFGGVRHPERASWSEDDLRAALEADLRALGAHRLVRVLGVDRWRWAIAQPALGHAARLAAIDAAQAGTALRCLGAWRGAGAMKDALLSAEALTDAMLSEARA
jgi:oxygen-dependent protoporphyrinogen oxidase